MNRLVAVTAAVALTAAMTACTASGTGPRVVTIVARYSHFEPSTVTVPRGTPVRFVLRNEDPIDHEFIVGDAGVQDRHERGTEPSHGTRPTERDLPSLTATETTITFDQAGTVLFACHAPGHYAYGMRGEIHVAR